MPTVLESSSTVEAPLQFGKRRSDNKAFYFYQTAELPDNVQQRSNVNLEEATVTFTDLRSCPEPFTLARNGFTVESLQTPAEMQWDDADQVKSLYFPKVEAVVKRATGAYRVLIFDHTLRKGSHREQQSKGVDKKLEAKPGMRAHVDYTLSSGPNRLKELLPVSEAEALQQHPYGIIQGWQPRKGPVLDSPLALCDASTLCQDDLIPTNLYFPDRTGQVYSVDHNPSQRWYYAKEMQTDEVYLFVGYDSREDGRARFVPHSSFEDPNTPADAPHRESIEFRAYVFWEPES